jgi:hypothetical protein
VELVCRNSTASAVLPDGVGVGEGKRGDQLGRAEAEFFGALRPHWITILDDDRSNPRDVVESGFIGEAVLRVETVEAVGLLYGSGGALGGVDGDVEAL